MNRRSATGLERRRLAPGWCALALLIGAAPAGVAADEPAAGDTARPTALIEACPVEWRGETLEVALSTLAARLAVPYLLDAGVDDDTLRHRIRMTGEHLTGEEAFRWLVRMADLEAVWVEGVFLVGPPERIPSLWQASRPGEGPSRGEEEADRWQRVTARRLDIVWVDAPLSRVARELSDLFEVDVVFDRPLIEEQPLITWEGASVDIGAVCAALAEELAARTERLDGAMWIHRRGPRISPSAIGATRPAEQVDADTARPGHAPPPHEPRVRVGQARRTWPSLVDDLAGTLALGSRVEVPPGAVYPGLDGEGTPFEILEAARLLGRLDWRIEPSESGRPGVLAVDIRVAEP